MGLVDNKIKQKEYIAKANQTEQKYGLPTNLLVGLLKTESNFDPEVISGRRKSSAGAIGIAQFMPGTAKDFGIDPRNVDQSIDAAGKYLSQNYKKLGDWDDTLRSYNMGLGNVYKWKQGKMKLPKETAEYVGKVYANMGGSGEYYGGADQGYKPQSYTTPQYVGQFINYGEGNYANTPTGVASEDTKEEAEAKQTIDKVTAEQQSMQEYFAQNTAVKPQQVQQPEQQVEPFSPIMEQYGQVSSFVDSPLAQEGTTVDMHGSPITAKIKLDNNVPRTFYDSRTNQMVLGSDYDRMSPEQKERVVAHENRHAWQYDNNRSNFDITHQPYLSFQARLQKKPQMMTTDDVYYNYHNRKSVESAKDIANIKNNTLGFSYVPNDIIFDKFVDNGQYDNPHSMEGETQYYEETGQHPQFQQGGFIKDNRGQWAHPGQLTEISSPNITMQDVSYPVLGISKETGEQKMMMPNQNYFFENTENVLEIPQLKNYFNKRK